jgi:hypothetical protein
MYVSKGVEIGFSITLSVFIVSFMTMWSMDEMHMYNNMFNMFVKMLKWDLYLNCLLKAYIIITCLHMLHLSTIVTTT